MREAAEKTRGLGLGDFQTTEFRHTEIENKMFKMFTEIKNKV